MLVKERADIAEVIGDNVTLRSAGGGNFKGLCPFHDEKSPSFSVRPSVGHTTASPVRPGSSPLMGLGRSASLPAASTRSSDATETGRSAVPVLWCHAAAEDHPDPEQAGQDACSPRTSIAGSFAPVVFEQGAREVLTRDLKPEHRLATVFPRYTHRSHEPVRVRHLARLHVRRRLPAGRGSVAMLAPGKDMEMLKWFPNSPATTICWPKAFARRGWVVQSVEETDRPRGGLLRRGARRPRLRPRGQHPHGYASVAAKAVTSSRS